MSAAWHCSYRPPGAAEEDGADVTLHTNLDLANERLPIRLYVPPVVGLVLESDTRHPNAPEFRLSLEVVRVTHCRGSIEAELHLTGFWKGQSLKEFYKMYEKATGWKFI